MKTIIWKELRENAKWGALALVATLIATVWILLYHEFESRPFPPKFLLNEFLLVTAFASSALPLLLGFTQTIPDLWRDRWAFLVQRGVSMNRIFLAKTIVAAILNVIVVGSAMAIAALWVSRGGIQRFPFEWRMLIPSLVTSIAAFGFFFAAVQVVLREAGFFVTRLLPLAIPGLVVFAAMVVTLEIDEHVPLFVWIGVILFTLMSAVGAWGVFVSHGEVRRMARVARVCIAIPNFAGLQTALYFGLVVCFVLVHFLFDGLTGYDIERLFDQEYVRHQYHVMKDGHLVRFTYRFTPTSIQYPQWNSKLLAVADLDAPDSKQYDSMLDPQNDDALAVHKPLQVLESVWLGNDNSLLSLFDYHSERHKLLTEIRGGEPRLNWWYSSTRGVILGYTQPVLVEEVWEPARLDTVIGPDGFATRSNWPTQRFGKLLGVAAGWRSRSRFAPLRTGFHHVTHVDRNFLLFDHGLYELDFTNRKLKKRYTPPAGTRIRNMVPLGELFVVAVDNDELHIHSQVSERIGHNENYVHRTGAEYDVESEDVFVNLPDKFVRSIPVPAELRPFDMFLFGIVPENQAAVFHYATGFRSMDKQRIVSLDPNGRIAHMRDIPFEKPLLGEYVVLGGFASLTPAGPVVAAGLIDAGLQEMDGLGPGLLGRQFMSDPAPSSFILCVLFASAILSARAARRSATRRGFTGRRRRVWLLIGLSLGPAGCLTLLSLYRRPARVECADCFRQRVIDREHCGQSFASPKQNGTEIYDSEVELRFVAAAG